MPAHRTVIKRGYVCLLTITLVAAAGCQRQPAPSAFAGTWVATSGRRVFMVLTLREQGSTFVGRWAHPDSFSISQNGAFSAITSRVTTSTIASAALEGTDLHLKVSASHDPNDVDEYLMTVNTGGESAVVRLVGAPLPPLTFTRHHGDVAPAVSTDWDAALSYKVDGVDMPSSAEMLAIFDEDQKVRQNFATIDEKARETISRSDKERRTRTAALLNGGALHSGADFRRAAFVFQHGDTPDDFLFAHTLALVALAKGDADGAWIAAASLDRYLQSIHQPQIYGTQFLTPAGKPATQDPYNRTLVSDSLRSLLGVPSLAGQQAQLAASPK
jgi:hypothetical protein